LNDHFPESTIFPCISPPPWGNPGFRKPFAAAAAAAAAATRDRERRFDLGLS